MSLLFNTKSSYNNIHLLYDIFFVLGVVIVRFNPERGNHFAVGLEADNIKPFLIHVDEYKSIFCGLDSLNTLPK